MYIYKTRRAIKNIRLFLKTAQNFIVEITKISLVTKIVLYSVIRLKSNIFILKNLFIIMIFIYYKKIKLEFSKVKIIFLFKLCFKFKNQAKGLDCHLKKWNSTINMISVKISNFKFNTLHECLEKRIVLCLFSGNNYNS